MKLTVRSRHPKQLTLLIGAVAWGVSGCGHWGSDLWPFPLYLRWGRPSGFRPRLRFDRGSRSFIERPIRARVATLLTGTSYRVITPQPGSTFVMCETPFPCGAAGRNSTGRFKIRFGRLCISFGGRVPTAHYLLRSGEGAVQGATCRGWSERVQPRPRRLHGTGLPVTSRRP